MKFNREPSETDLNEFANSRSWKNQMEKSQGFDSFSNYSGENLGDLVTSVGRSRDSDITSESNFAVALDMLGDESDTVTVKRFGHWGCGWFELILVDPRDRKALRTAYDISQCLEEHPLLDDSDYSQRQYDSHTEYAKGAEEELAQALAYHLGLPEEMETDEDLLGLAFRLNMECQSYYGDDACINLRQNSEPDDYQIKKIENSIGQMYGYENPALELLKSAFNITA